jgi:hypothetical protein
MRTPILFQAKFFNLLFASALFLVLGCQSQPKTVKQLLAEIATIDSLKQIEGDTLFLETWELWFSQPVDHNNPEGERFPHRVIYSHKSFDNPMVIVIEGYKIFSLYASEPTILTSANQITIEHRFFEKSRPFDSIPWEFLNIYQAATDQHKVIQQFKPFYKAKWISTGISKGGQATIYHRYFYPNDVDISIPYVAPLNFSSEDERVYSFLENVSTPECRERVRAFQEELFKRKDRLMPLLEMHAKNNGYTFEFGLSRAFDVNVLEYSFAFWQWSGMDCSHIPSTSAIDVEVFNHWTRVAPFDFIEDKGIEANRPFFYQAMTEIGMYGYELENWRKYLDDDSNITFDFTMPKGHSAFFNPEPMQDVNEWVENSGNYMLYIYGEYDPWSATAVNLSDKTNAVKFVNPKGDHTTRIKSFPPQMQEEIYSTLESWLGQPLNR